MPVSSDLHSSSPVQKSFNKAFGSFNFSTRGCLIRFCYIMGTNTHQGMKHTVISQTKSISTSLDIWVGDHCPSTKGSEADYTDCCQASAFFQSGSKMRVPVTGSSSVKNTAPVSSWMEKLPEALPFEHTTGKVELRQRRVSFIVTGQWGTFSFCEGRFGYVALNAHKLFMPLIQPSECWN